jgi:hypothetical protein
MAPSGCCWEYFEGPLLKEEQNSLAVIMQFILFDGTVSLVVERIQLVGDYFHAHQLVGLQQISFCFFRSISLKIRVDASSQIVCVRRGYILEPQA